MSTRAFIIRKTIIEYALNENKASEAAKKILKARDIYNLH